MASTWLSQDGAALVEGGISAPEFIDPSIEEVRANLKLTKCLDTSAHALRRYR